MANKLGFRSSKLQRRMAAALLLAAPVLASSLAAQQQGPLPAPSASEPGHTAPPAQPAAASQAPAAKPQGDSGSITHEPPSIPVEQIIQKFGDRELEFKKERDNYTYTQTFLVQTIDTDGQPDGEYRMTSDILFTPEGKRYEKVISAPAPTLQRISLSQQDMDDLEHVQPSGADIDYLLAAVNESFGTSLDRGQNALERPGLDRVVGGRVDVAELQGGHRVISAASARQTPVTLSQLVQRASRPL